MTNHVKKEIALYLHIPFCVSKCHYCDFNSFGIGSAPAPEATYLERLLQEIRAAAGILATDVSWEGKTVFFGGGTPSLFSPVSIGKIIEELRRLLPLDPKAEITLEMNPKTASLEKMRGFLEAGVNRLSVGIQTLDDTLLHGLGRAHSAADALQTLTWAYAAGFQRVNADLMYGLSGQSVGHVESSLARLEPFPLCHLSAYELIVEEGTPFYDRYLDDRLPLPRTEEVLRMRSRIQEFSEKKGMVPYEISNYAGAGHESEHNLRYWNYDSFLGFGAGAVSFLREDELHAALPKDGSGAGDETRYGRRWTNPRALAAYGAAHGVWQGVALETISRREAMGEFMMMGLRRCEGVRYAEFQRKFAEPIPENFRHTITTAGDAGLMTGDLEGCRFTEEGLLLSNEVLQKFL